MTKKEQSFSKLYDTLHTTCLDSLGDNISILDVLDALSMVKNNILSESIHVDIEIGFETLFNTKIEDLKYLSKKTPENHGVGA